MGGNFIVLPRPSVTTPDEKSTASLPSSKRSSKSFFFCLFFLFISCPPHRNDPYPLRGDCKNPNIIPTFESPHHRMPYFTLMIGNIWDQYIITFKDVVSCLFETDSVFLPIGPLLFFIPDV